MNVVLRLYLFIQMVTFRVLGENRVGVLIVHVLIFSDIYREKDIIGNWM